MGKLRYLIICSCLFFGGFINKIYSQDSTWLRQQIAILTADDMFGRSGAHNGEQKAAQFLQKHFQNIGAQPLAENGFQRFSTMGHKMEGVVRIQTNKKILNSFDEFRIAPFATTTHVSNMSMVKVDASILLDSIQMNAFLLKNKETLYHKAIIIDATHWKNAKKFSAERIKKALHNITIKNPFPAKVILICMDELPVWSLVNTDFQRDFAIIYIKKTALKGAKTITIDFDNTFFLKKSQNVCYAFQGTTYPDQFIILTAHYDHIGCMGDSVIFHGAHDNASGVAAVMDFARYFASHPPAFTTVFVLFTGEESGLKGSEYFINHPLVPLDDVKLMVNLDMFCGGDEGIMVVNAEAENTKPIVDKMIRINEKAHYVSTVKRRPNAANSDHYYFSKYCPAIFIYTIGGKHGGYHNYTDTCDECGLICYSNMFNLLRALITSLS